ncbi:transposase [Anaerofustis stercorihominis]|uniref:transposase n=1 Tax=Anaerofustis stercorihominis TaxID=214853 RepID=UPI002672A0CE|nr:transposase [Anaerofustis stercorihominis]
MRRGRKNKYEELVKPRLNEIQSWSEDGLYENQIADKLGIGYSTFNRYKVENEELREVIKKGRLKKPVKELENTLFKKALGFHYKEKKITEEIDKDGNEITKKVIVEKYIPPDTGSAIYLLNNWGRYKGYCNNPAMMELKLRELALKEKKFEEDSW